MNDLVQNLRTRAAVSPPNDASWSTREETNAATT
jgi:hypothetical protein